MTIADPIAAAVLRHRIPAVTAIEKARTKYAAGVIPRVSNPGGSISQPMESTIGASAQRFTEPNASIAVATGAPANTILTAHHLTSPTDWVRAGT